MLFINQTLRGFIKMKKIISVLSLMAILFSGYAQSAQDQELVDVCKEAAERDDVAADKLSAYIDQCVKDILAEDKKEEAESK